MINRNKITFLSFFSLFGTFFASTALAICPVCVVGVGAGVGLTRWLKIDDTITGLWIGALTVSLIAWTIEWLKKKNIDFKGRNLITIIAYYAMVFWPLHSLEAVGNGFNTIWGMDKLIFSIVLGSISFFGFEKWYRSMRAKRGKSMFRYQKVIWPMIPLIVFSIIFFFITR
jgi:hypothetical protein